jgi:hypothetical protein
MLKYGPKSIRNTYFKTTPDATSIGPSTIAQTSRLNVNGSLALPLKKVTPPYMITTEDYNVVSTDTGTLTLPNAATATQRIYVLKNAASDTVMLNTTASQKIKNLDADTAICLFIPPGESRTLQSDGNDWVVKYIPERYVPEPPIVTTPAGSTGQVQYNNSGAFAASENLKWEENTRTLNIGTGSASVNASLMLGSRLGRITGGTGGLILNATGSQFIMQHGGVDRILIDNYGTSISNVQGISLNATNSVDINGESASYVSGGGSRLSMNDYGAYLVGPVGSSISLDSSGTYISGNPDIDLYAGGDLRVGAYNDVSLHADGNMQIETYGNMQIETYENMRIETYKVATIHGYEGINIQTGFQDVVTVKLNGNVGIGTTSPAHKLDVSGAGGFDKVVTKSVVKDARTISSTTTLNDSYSLVEADNSTAMTVNLPLAEDSKGIEFTVIKSSNNSNAVTVQAGGSNLINGSATFVLGAQWKTVTIWSTGQQWLIKYSN